LLRFIFVFFFRGHWWDFSDTKHDARRAVVKTKQNKAKTNKKPQTLKKKYKKQNKQKQKTKQNKTKKLN
jgi:hypothetical protein